MATTSRVGLSMGQIGIADAQNEVDGLLSGLESDKIWQDGELASAVSTSNRSAELTVISKGVLALQEIGTSPWAGQGRAEEQNYGNSSGPRPGKQCSLSLPEPGRTVRKKRCVNWRLTLGTRVLKGQLCPLENKLEQ